MKILLLLLFFWSARDANRIYAMYFCFLKLRKSNQVGLPKKTFNKPRYTHTPTHWHTARQIPTRNPDEKTTRAKEHWAELTCEWCPNVTFHVSARTKFEKQERENEMEREKCAFANFYTHLSCWWKLFQLDACLFILAMAWAIATMCL